MKKILLTISVFITYFYIAQSAWAFEFSADMVSRTQQETLRGKVYVSDNAARIELPGLGATITRMDKKLAWVLMDQQHMYMEHKFDPNTAASVSEKVEGELERIPLGDEVIEGRNTKKYRVVTDTNGERSEMHQWIDKETAIPIKTASIDGKWSIQYYNFKMGPQDSALFEIPAGYTKFSIPTMDDIKAMMHQEDEQ
jgi:hypothetical protein